MADAVAGADIGSAEIEIVEPQRIRVVSIFHAFSPKQSFLRLVFFREKAIDNTTSGEEASLTTNSYLDLPTLLLHSNSQRRTTLWAMLCDTLS